MYWWNYKKPDLFRVADKNANGYNPIGGEFGNFSQPIWRLPGDLATDMWRQGCSFYTIYNWKRSTCLTQESGWINHDMPTSQSTMQLYKRMTRISIKQYGGISRRHYYVGGEGQVQDWGMFHLCKKKKEKIKYTCICSLVQEDTQKSWARNDWHWLLPENEVKMMGKGICLWVGSDFWNQINVSYTCMRTIKPNHEVQAETNELKYYVISSTVKDKEGVCPQIIFLHRILNLHLWAKDRKNSKQILNSSYEVCFAQ